MFTLAIPSVNAVALSYLTGGDLFTCCINETRFAAGYIAQLMGKDLFKIRGVIKYNLLCIFYFIMVLLVGFLLF